MFSSVQCITCEDMIDAIQEGLAMTNGGNKIDVAYVVSNTAEKTRIFTEEQGIKDGLVIAEPEDNLSKMFQIPFKPYALMYGKEGALEQIPIWRSRRLFLIQLATFVDRRKLDDLGENYVPEAIARVLMPGAPIPQFEAVDINGKSVNSSDLSSQKTVITFNGYDVKIGIEALLETITTARSNENLDDQMQFVHLFNAYSGTVKTIARKLGLKGSCIADPDGTLANKFLVYDTNHYAMYNRGSMVTGIDYKGSPEETGNNLALFASNPQALIEKMNRRGSSGDGHQH